MSVLRIGHNVRRVFIGQSDTALGAVAAELASDFEEANCALLIGAGASAAPPSNLPLATSLMLELRRALWKSVLPFVRSHQLPATARESAKAILKEARLERILHALQETHGPKAIHRFLDVFDAEQWNQTHALIASLATSGRLPVCITLNFDCLIEKSIQAHGGGVRTECPLKDNAGFETGGDPVRCRLIKPHGSIAPAGFEGGRYSLLAPTLDEIGNHPDPRNVAAIDSSLRGRSLLVLGYSDNDWDIFPILERAADHLRHVYWVQYANKAVVERRLDPVEPSFPRIISWLERCRSKTTLLVGDPAELLRSVCGELRIKTMRPKDSVTQRVRRVETGHLIESDSAMTATSVAFALLLQDRGRFHDDLSRWLLSSGRLRGLETLEARLRRSVAHSHHTRRELIKAIAEMKQVIRLKKRTYGSLDWRESEDLVWLGYEHLCLVKRPSWRWPAVGPLAWHLARGRQYMRQGVTLSRHQINRRKRRRLRALMHFYWGDLLHTWAGLCLLVGSWLSWIAHPLLRRAAQCYNRAKRIDPESMSWEYYWLRLQEARLLCGLELADPDASLETIERIEHSYSMLQNHVQRGNTLAYGALIKARHGGDRNEVEGMLDEAERIWSASDGFVPSGLLRILLFRRYLKLRGMIATIRDLARLWRLTRANRT